MNKPNKKEHLTIFEKKSSFSHHNKDFILEAKIAKNDSLKDQSKNNTEIKNLKNSSPVCFAESDEIRDEYKLKP